MLDPESKRLREDAQRINNWKRWGPYLSDRQWGTVREDYSADGNVWDYFPHDHARSRAYRWGEDGILGICDRECRLCFAITLWNGRDGILKERYFGLTGPQGNHGEDAKELWYYLDATPTSSYCKGLYKYPQAAYPYEQIKSETARRSRNDPEFELLDTGVFNGNRYFDVCVEYAKNSPNDILIRITATNRGPESATLHLLPTTWFRNTWTWGPIEAGDNTTKPQISVADAKRIAMTHPTLGDWQCVVDQPVQWLMTENETNGERIYQFTSASPYVKDAYHPYLINGKTEAVNPQGVGTKAAAYVKFEIPAGESATMRLRLSAMNETSPDAFGEFERVFKTRIAEAEKFYASTLPALPPEQALVARQAYAGLLWSKQFYHYVVLNWLNGDPGHPKPPEQRLSGRNSEWTHVFTRDIISMPDKWEYPWFAAWDLAFHMITLSRVDPQNAKEQLILFLREWYTHANGQLPAYEFNFGDVNPPVHAWACWRVYKMTGPRGKRDIEFLKRTFQKLMINFTWWVNRKDINGKQIFAGGFLGLDNIGIFDRSKPLKPGQYLEQADGTAWMAFFCNTMLSMALELADQDPTYEDVASKFFEHFIAITDAMNTLGGTGLWDEQDGFYYDQLNVDGQATPIRIRSLVGVVPLFACEVLPERLTDRLPGFAKRMNWFIANRPDLSRFICYMEGEPHHPGIRLLALANRDKLLRVLRYLLDENEFLSPFGLRSVSKVHKDRPFVLRVDDQNLEVHYTPGESDTSLFGGNSNWRGPIWFPLNYLLIEALERYHHFYGDELKVECPVGSGKWMTLLEVAEDLATRLTKLFLPNAEGHRPAHGGESRYADDPAWKDLVLFYEYFHGDTGKGLGASHQTGWTALVAQCLERLTRRRKTMPAATS